MKFPFIFALGCALAGFAVSFAPAVSITAQDMPEVDAIALVAASGIVTAYLAYSEERRLQERAKALILGVKGKRHQLNTYLEAANCQKGRK